jgi:hypothetical protein
MHRVVVVAYMQSYHSLYRPHPEFFVIFSRSAVRVENNDVFWSIKRFQGKYDKKLLDLLLQSK